MNRSSSVRRGVLLFASCLLLALTAPRAQADPPPIPVDKEYTALMDISNRNGGIMKQRIYASDGKFRADQMGNGMDMTVLVLPDQQKMYSIINQQKMAMLLPYDPTKMKAQMALANGQGTFEKIGPSTANSIACDEYKFTGNDGKVFNVWFDPRNKVPVQVQPEDQSMTIVFREYHAGPQPQSLFEIPPGYTVMTMPGMPALSAPPPGQ